MIAPVRQSTLIFAVMHNSPDVVVPAATVLYSYKPFGINKLEVLGVLKALDSVKMSGKLAQESATEKALLTPTSAL